ncbi:Vacuolar protein sorting-associated protein 35 [Balamuthia mandrillaris]
MSSGKKAKPVTPSVLPSEEEQRKLLEEAQDKVRKEAFQMKRCLDHQKLMEALKHASTMIAELRTSMLSPKNYYELYMAAFNELRHLESFLAEERQKGKKMSELYEVVQYAGNILPRLYLLITVGSIYIKSKEAPAKDVLRDLVEMCRGVQHPTRGLFLRNYLSEMSKDMLPDTGGEYEGEGGTVKDSVSFILQNFTEMNKLWVRMQHQGPVKDKIRRETERKELRLLVGKNLARLSQLEGVDVPLYKKSVLPKIMEQIVSCKDQIAQQYLMEIVIQIFPDNFHLETLDMFLETCSKLQANVEIKTIIVSLIERLANYATQPGNHIPANINVFEIFFKQIKTIIEEQPKMPPEDMLALQVSLLNLALKVYAGNIDYVDQVLNATFNLLSKFKEQKVDYQKQSCVKHILSLLTIPLTTFNNVLTLIKLQNYSNIIQFLSYYHRKKMAIDMVQNAIANETIIPEPEDVESLFFAIHPLLKDEEDQDEVDEEDFEEEQNAVASLVHLCDNSSPEKVFKIFATARKVFGQGGTKRIRHTLPPLVFRSLKLATQLKQRTTDEDEWHKVGTRIFKFAHETVTALAKTDYKELAMRLFLQCSKAASTCGFERIAYEFLTQVFEIYETDVADSKAQFRAINEIIGTLQTLRCFSEENYDTLSTKTAMHSAKLLKKPDQCRAVYMCSHLFWTGDGEATEEENEYRDGKRVLECLQKSLRIAGSCMDATLNVQLFVEILNEYLYYFEHRNEAIAVKYLTGLIALIKTNLANMEIGEGKNHEVAEQVNTYYANTLKHIEAKQEAGQTEGGSIYDEIEL